MQRRSPTVVGLILVMTASLGACSAGGAPADPGPTAGATSSASTSSASGGPAAPPAATSPSGAAPGSVTAPTTAASTAAAPSILTGQVLQLATSCTGQCGTRVPGKLRPQVTAVCAAFTELLRTWVGGAVSFDDNNPFTTVRGAGSTTTLGCGYRARKLDAGSFPGDLALTLAGPSAPAPALGCPAGAVCADPGAGQRSTLVETDASLAMLTHVGWWVHVSGTSGRTHPTVAMATALLTSVDALVGRRG